MMWMPAACGAASPALLLLAWLAALTWTPTSAFRYFYKGWTFRPDVQLRNTVYSQQQFTATSCR